MARAALDGAVSHPERLEALREALEGEEEMSPPAAASEVRYLPCAQCDQRMARRNYGQRSGVIVDACVTHGTWFDAQELRKVLDFVAAGGLPRGAAGPRDRALQGGNVRHGVAAAPDVAANASTSAGELAGGALELVLELAAWAAFD